VTQDIAESAAVAEDGELSHREIMLAMSGTMLGMFVALLSGAIVVNALPRIVPELGGSQTGYTWVIVASFLTLTTFNPVWGKLADLFDIRHLVTVALVVYVTGGLLGTTAQSIPMLIGARAVIGLGMGGISTLGQVVIARLAPPRLRGKYAGYSGASYALGTVCGPLVGGLIADSPLGWRGCFWVPLPLALLAILLARRTLRIAHVRRRVSIDYAGGILLIVGVGTLLVLLSLGGSHFAWLSGTAALLAGGSVLALVALVVVETRIAREPIVQVRFFTQRTVLLMVLCAALIGIAPYSATVYLTEYYQYAHGLSPTQAGLLTIPMILGITGTGVVSGRLVAHTGRWKPVALTGMGVLIVGMLLIGTADRHTAAALVAAASLVLGIGMGSTTQNLVLAVQNVVEDAVVGSATSLVLFAQALGGTIGITVLGAVLSHRVSSALPQLGGTLPDPTHLPAALRDPYRTVMGHDITHLFTLMAPQELVAVALCLLTAGSRMRAHRALREDGA
jgi:MFS family permease